MKLILAHRLQPRRDDRALAEDARRRPLAEKRSRPERDLHPRERSTERHRRRARRPVPTGRGHPEFIFDRARELVEPAAVRSRGAKPDDDFPGASGHRAKRLGRRRLRRRGRVRAVDIARDDRQNDSGRRDERAGRRGRHRGRRARRTLRSGVPNVRLDGTPGDAYPRTTTRARRSSARRADRASRKHASRARCQSRERGGGDGVAKTRGRRASIERD